MCSIRHPIGKREKSVVGLAAHVLVQGASERSKQRQPAALESVPYPDFIWTPFRTPGVNRELHSCLCSWLVLRRAQRAAELAAKTLRAVRTTGIAEGLNRNRTRPHRGGAVRTSRASGTLPRPWTQTWRAI